VRKGSQILEDLLLEFCIAKLHAWFTFTSGKPEVLAAQGIGGAGPPQVAIGRKAVPPAAVLFCVGTPAKPGFLRSKKCAQMLAATGGFHSPVGGSAALSLYAALYRPHGRWLDFYLFFR
jgi:hypothetical protein